MILPFANLTQDPALAKTVQDDVIGGLVRLQACPIAAQDDVAAQIEKLGLGSEGLADGDLRKRLAQRFECDTIMVGALNSYSESVKEEPPSRLKQRDGSFRWGYADVSTVSIDATVKIMDANTGNILWVRKAAGNGATRRWVDLPWPGEKETSPPQGWEELRAQAAKGKSVDTPKDDGKQPGKDSSVAAPAASPGGQTINIIIQQQATQTQQQEQTQAQTQAQSQTASPAETKPVLLYQSDNNVFRARQDAISRTAQIIMSDYRGAFGWKPVQAGQQ